MSTPTSRSGRRSPTTSPRSTPTPTRSSRCSPTWSRTRASTPTRRACGSTGAVDDGEVVGGGRRPGRGHPRARPARVFTKFFRRAEGRPTGSGLGLWISRGLVEAHGGQLTAESRSGQGSTFRFTLPLPSPSRSCTRDRWTCELDDLERSEGRGRIAARPPRRRSAARSRPRCWASGPRCAAERSASAASSRTQREAWARRINEARDPLAGGGRRRAGRRWRPSERAARLEAERLDLTEVLPGPDGAATSTWSPRPATASRTCSSAWASRWPRAPRSRPTGTTSRPSTSRPATRPGACTTRLYVELGRARVDAAAHAHLAGADPGDGSRSRRRSTR